VSDLIAAVRDINIHRGSDRKSALHWAAINDWDEVIHTAVQRSGAEPDLTDISGKTALHYAAELGNHASARRLLRCGASARVKDNFGRTPVQAAAVEGFADVLNLPLLESDLDVNEQDSQGCSLLHWAASWDWNPLMAMVLEQPNIDLLKRNCQCRTALHIAAVCGLNLDDMTSTRKMHLGTRSFIWPRGLAV
jgi:ankyrin repeat protein